MAYTTINWNVDEDELDEYVFDKATAQYWLDTRVPVSNDILDWQHLSATERDVINKVVGGLALLDTLQSEEGVDVMRRDVRTRKEMAVINDFLMMESIHAKSYGTILTTLNDEQVVKDAFHWMNNNEQMQFKVKKINAVYQNGTGLQKKVASVFLEGILYYDNFFTPLWYRGNNKLANLSEIIKLVIRDESVHGTYLGYKFHQGFDELSEPEQKQFRKWMDNLLDELLENEFKFTDVVYGPIGLAEDVKQFVRYNANKAMQNMGFDSIFPNAELKDINPIVMNGINTETANHDFFSQVGAGYLMGNAEAMNDDDYDF
ncbi:class 1b ribonucleoside-diphosphate reductase subunit beta [Nicoliella lavandulae]|uniref:ribonucleoside-diphosphate reductase n=1 Tax=Nicoliella lavandulae TaxID=3082954 RepID=A0ABU8SJH3_9LACO